MSSAPRAQMVEVPEIPLAGDLFNVKGLVAAVTGAGGGIGLLMARTLEANGAKKVFILDVNETKLEEACRTSKFGRLHPITCDITSKSSLARAASLVRSEAGRLDLLVANAGIPGPYPPPLGISPGYGSRPVGEVADAWWEAETERMGAVYAVNNVGTFYTCLAFLELLDSGGRAPGSGSGSGEKSGGGGGVVVRAKSQIVLTASLTGMSRTASSGFAYGTSKAAVIHLGKMLATYLVPWGVRCNVVAPGLYPSEMSGPALAASGDGLLATIPAGRTGTPEDMAGVILFLASRAGAYANGMVMLSDGGRLSTLPATY